MSPSINLSPIVIAHLATVIPAVLLGGAMLLMRKGTRLHRMSGRVWALLMFSTALISFGIKSNGSYSWIHLLSIWTLINLAIALYFVLVKRNILMHQIWISGLYVGTLVAGAMAFLPQRALGSFVAVAAGLS